MKLTGWLLLVAAVGALWLWDRHSQYEAGKASANAQEARVRVETLTKLSIQAETVFRAGKRVYVQGLAHWDTIVQRETIRVEVPGKPESTVVYVPLAPAESTIRLCSRTLVLCENRHRADSALNAGLRLQVKAEQKRHPSFMETWGWRLGAFVVGYSVGK